ncbi:MAG: cobalamin biosynthesis protein CobW [Rhizobiales bacterium]|nr:cobalamin biosynthesis protein CobW [Hyphomicrobiales bacterium]MBO6698869.1 cobalamin biosynthesis protein CobW [Hyphomicrobiales bacterium]MBO6734878.1 cobalamin biosynthesis protein CobW [Hyphomicrobiales bacterium]MBO6911316.1 cobalamin biosynthesis protein CobW [Hyphomicrobiales bacterium]MBO6956186.1 cobalamin biosynthesis protein CobW [Hyphomicrobiales bacterium]
MTAPIPATIITGFLGAGKTTLIQNLIRSAGGKRIALVVNEFGDLGFDGEQIAGCGIEGCADEDVIELTNGCICCTVADDFLPTMEMLLAREPAPEHIVIETSGLALPQPLVQAFQWPSVAARTTVDGVVTVADAEALAHGLYAPDPAKVEAQRAADDSLDHETPVEELFADQMRCADLVVLSKTDRIASEALETVNEALDGKRAGVGVVRSTADGLPAHLLIGLGAGAEQDMHGREAGHHHHEDDHHDHHHHDHSHDEFDSRVVTTPAFESKQALDAFVGALCAKPGVLRVKGVAQVEGKAAPVVVQAVGPRVTSHFDTSGRQQKPGLVVIGLSPLADLSDVPGLANAA